MQGTPTIHSGPGHHKPSQAITGNHWSLPHQLVCAFSFYDVLLSHMFLHLGLLWSLDPHPLSKLEIFSCLGVGLVGEVRLEKGGTNFNCILISACSNRTTRNMHALWCSSRLCKKHQKDRVEAIKHHLP